MSGIRGEGGHFHFQRFSSLSTKKKTTSNVSRSSILNKQDNIDHNWKFIYFGTPSGGSPAVQKFSSGGGHFYAKIDFFFNAQYMDGYFYYKYLVHIIQQKKAQIIIVRKIYKHQTIVVILRTSNLQQMLKNELLVVTSEYPTFFYQQININLEGVIQKSDSPKSFIY